MTTIAQLVRSAKSRLIPYLESKGFQHYGKLAFAKVVGNGVHQVISAELSHGENLKFNVRCFVEEYGAKYMEKYPFNIPITCGGRLGEEPIAGELWDVGRLDGIEHVWADVVKKLKDSPCRGLSRLPAGEPLWMRYTPISGISWRPEGRWVLSCTARNPDYSVGGDGILKKAVISRSGWTVPLEVH